MNKPIKEWLEELPDGYRERALKNYDPDWQVDDNADSRTMALELAFSWKQSPEGILFWGRVYNHLTDVDTPKKIRPLPKLSETTQ